MPLSWLGNPSISAISRLGNPSISAISRPGNPSISAISRLGNPSISAISWLGNPSISAISRLGNPSITIPLPGDLPASGGPSTITVDLAGLDPATCSYTVQPGDAALAGQLQALLFPGMTIDQIVLPPAGSKISLPAYGCDFVTQIVQQFLPGFTHGLPSSKLSGLTSTRGVRWLVENHGNISRIGTRNSFGRLGAHATIREGSTGSDVIAWQQILIRDIAISQYPYTADGNFGAGTKLATQTWQRAHNLIDDGVVGPATWAAATAGTAKPPVAPADLILFRKQAYTLAKYFAGGPSGAGTSVGEMLFEEVTQGRNLHDKKYSACGCLPNFMTWRLGCRDQGFVNRDEPSAGLIYTPSYNISLPVGSARARGQWRTLANGLPEPGDLVLIGQHPNEKEHMFVLLDINGDTWTSADYGQQSAEGASSAIVTRVKQGGNLVRFGGARSIVGWIDIESLPLTASVNMTGVPQPWPGQVVPGPVVIPTRQSDCLNAGGSWDGASCTFTSPPAPPSSGGGGSDDTGILILVALVLVGVAAAAAASSGTGRKANPVWV